MGDLPRLIVFDLDGTLIDSRQDLADSANALIVERGGAPLPEDAIVEMVGEGAAALVRRALTAARLPEEAADVDRFLALYRERLLRTTRAYPGIVETLGALAPVATLAVLTNKPIAPTRAILEGLDLSRFFSSVLGGDGPLPRKPNPSSLHHLMSLYGAQPVETVLVGDSSIDLRTARAAGTGLCLARYGFGYASVAADGLNGRDMLVDHPREISVRLRRHG